MTQRDYTYNYCSKTFNIFLDGKELIVTKPDGTVIESKSIDIDNPRPEFERLKDKYILDYGNVL